VANRAPSEDPDLMSTVELWTSCSGVVRALSSNGLVDEDRRPGVSRTQPDGTVESVRWDDIAEVALVTTSDGPFEDDVFFVLAAADGTGCAVPMSESDGLLPRLQRLPGFDNETFIRAMAWTEEGLSVLWRRPPTGSP
jgi:hypothetical protein